MVFTRQESPIRDTCLPTAMGDLGEISAIPFALQFTCSDHKVRPKEERKKKQEPLKGREGRTEGLIGRGGGVEGTCLGGVGIGGKGGGGGRNNALCLRLRQRERTCVCIHCYSSSHTGELKARIE